MIDRGSTFANETLLALLRDELVPVALDQAYQRRQDDAEGRLYRRIAGQGPRNDFNGTTQGFYVASAGGELLLYNNNRHPEKVARLVGEAVARHRAGFEKGSTEAVEPDPDEPLPRDPRYAPRPPEGGLVVRARARVLGGYPEPKGPFDALLHEALSRDNLWITAAEHQALAAGTFPGALARRLARFHLVDNTRGEPPMWRPEEIRELDLTLTDGRIHGRVRLATDDGSRTYRAALAGTLRVEDGRVVALTLVARGLFEGEGRYTRGAPEGEFPLAVAFTLADGTDVADAIPPQGSRGWVAGYLR